jgi:hypothetical protein
MSDLGKFKRLPILTTSAMIAKANTRLSETLAIKPRLFDSNETVFAIVRLVKVKDRFDYQRVDDLLLGVEQVQMFEAKSAVFFDEEDKDEMMGTVLQKAVDLFIEAEAARKGQLTLHLEDDGEDDGE